MYAAALRDSLTGVFNRRYLDDHLERELAFAKRHRYPLALLMVDIDHFKRVNDKHGHRVGDAALRHVADTLLAGSRTEDVVARYGGEEFAVVCRNTDERNATRLAERLRDAVGKKVFDFEGRLIRLTISIGVAGSFENNAIRADKLVDAADEALYHAKNGGRNCWRAASTRPPTSSGQYLLDG